MRNLKRPFIWALVCVFGVGVADPSYAYGFGPDFCAECLAISTSNPETNGTTLPPRNPRGVKYAGYTSPELMRSSLGDLVLYMDRDQAAISDPVTAHFDALKKEGEANPNPFPVYHDLTSTQWAAMSTGAGGFGQPGGQGNRPAGPVLIDPLTMPFDPTITTSNYQNGEFVRDPFAGIFPAQNQFL